VKRIPLAVIGAGLIGRTHVDRALRSPDVHLVGIADPSETGRRCQRRHNVDSHFLSGTEGSLTLPRLAYWHYRGKKGWEDELTERREALHLGDPYAEQMRHFCAVIDGKEAPLCSAADGSASLRATLAVAAAGAEEARST